MLDMLDGYLAAIVIGPITLLPSQWLPGIWGPSEDDAPRYESMEQVQRILELIMRHMNGIAWALRTTRTISSRCSTAWSMKATPGVSGWRNGGRMVSWRESNCAGRIGNPCSTTPPQRNRCAPFTCWEPMTLKRKKKH